MGISEKYLTYQDYKTMGGTLNHAPFILLENECSRKIDIRTQNRLSGVEEIPVEVKYCVFNLIESLSVYNKLKTNMSDKGNLASTTTDGYSESYLTPVQIKDLVKSKNNEISEIIKTWLTDIEVNGENLLYPGVYVSK